MRRGFFEGESYSTREFKALIPKYYPVSYQKYIKEETDLLVSRLKGSQRVLEAGVGLGRLIPKIAPFVKRLIGIDNSNFMVVNSLKVAKKFSNVEIIKGDIGNLSKIFSKNYFDHSLCVWNTLGNVSEPVKILAEFREITNKSIFITVFLKGTLKQRLELYKSIDVEVISFDESDETFFLRGYESKTFDIQDISNIAKKVGLEVRETKILSDVILFAELVKSK